MRVSGTAALVLLLGRAMIGPLFSQSAWNNVTFTGGEIQEPDRTLPRALVLLLVGPKVVALPMMPLAGAVLGALAAICTIMVSGTLLTWFVVWSLAAALCSVVIFVGQRERWRRRHPHAGRGAHPLAFTGAIAVAAAVAWTLRTLRVHNIGSSR